MTNTIKVFISVPMTGRTESEILEQIEKEKSKAFNHFHNDCDTKVIFLASYITEEDIKGNQDRNNNIYLLAKSIEILSCANTIWMGENWQKSRGCQVEHKVAIEYGLMICYSDRK